MNLIYLACFVLFIVAIGYFLKMFLEKQQSEELLPYREKKYFFSRSEREFLRTFNESIDKKRYLIFTKVRLADFIEVTIKGKEYLKWWNKIKSKHIDFLIWDIQENRIILAIELDGKSHKSKKMKERDVFVNKLYETVKIRLERVAVGSDFSMEVKRMVESLNI